MSWKLPKPIYKMSIRELTDAIGKLERAEVEILHQVCGNVLGVDK